MNRWASAVCAALVALCIGATAAAAAPPHQRLTRTQWGTYQKAYAAYATQTTKTVATFRKCRQLQVSGRYADALKACLGTTAQREMTVTTALSNTLKSFQGRVTGACAQTLGAYQQALFLWTSNIAGMQRIVSSGVGQGPAVQAQADTAILAAQKVNSSAALFKKLCAPPGTK